MGSPTKGMWTCQHGVDGRDWCSECYAPDTEDSDMIEQEEGSPDA